MSRYDPLLDDFEEDSEVTVSSGFKKSTGNSDGENPVSYTHLPLPTILLV